MSEKLSDEELQEFATHPGHDDGCPWCDDVKAMAHELLEARHRKETPSGKCAKFTCANEATVKYEWKEENIGCFIKLCAEHAKEFERDKTIYHFEDLLEPVTVEPDKGE